MKDTIHTVLESDLLERYLTGETSVEESLRAEHLIGKYPEIEKEYEILQENLELFIRSYAVEAPEDLRKEIVSELGKSQAADDKKPVSWLFIAASVAAMIFAMATVTLWKQNKLLSDQNNTVATQIEDLKKDIVLTNSKLENVKSKFAVLNNPETKKYYITGNERAKNLKSVAYINSKERLSAINVLSLPELPKEKELKMWAEINGKMVCLGTLEQADRKLMALPFNEDATAYKITIESKGNNNFATIDTEVADIRFDQE
ncbi:anti-sigma factor domain-containing protein [Robertkochia aurantiaca]|uniref:anti-sigma factor domain-containing protein n=1 Tax=Robertkochia aurantiaca TaxID=2873700 RepID=UPI001CCE4575|nr:anti-sigma factor [Robertkochia sp. 3YJGBD-33]